uniref:ELMO domain-containing protein n=1 Tax=Strongyloides venezuelensis TaxID=75913 RepID=A0A0K0G251_STRVS
MIGKGLNPIDIRLPQSVVKGAVKLDPSISNYLVKPFKFPTDPRNLSCYVQYDKSTDTIAEFLKNVTRQLELPEVDDVDSYSLMFEDNGVFVSEERVDMLKQGFILMLTASPGNYVQFVEKALETGSEYSQETLKTLQLMERLAKDKVFLEAYEKVSGMEKIILYIKSGKFSQNGISLSSLFNIFLTLMSTLEGQNPDKAKFYWYGLGNDFISEVASHISGRTKLESNESLTASLNVIDFILKKCQNSQLCQLQREVPFESLIMHLEKSDKRIPVSILNLMSSLYWVADETLKVDILQILKNNAFRSMICKLLKRQDSITVDSELAKPLLKLQDIIMSDLSAKALKKPTDVEIEIIRNMESLNPCIFDGNIYHVSPSKSSLTTTTFGVDEDDISTSSFSDVFPTLVIDWSEFTDLVTKTPPGLLVLEAILYFDEKYPQLLRDINTENIVWQETSSWPFPIVSVYLVSIIIDLFSIIPNKPDNSEIISKLCDKFKRSSTLSRDSNETVTRENKLHLIFFTVESPFHELFALSVRLFRRTWREMHASHEDVIKVLKVVKEQLERSLDSSLLSIKEYDNNLQKYSYYQMQKIWELERFEKDQSELQSDAIRHLTPKIRLEMEKLVKQNRKNEMKKGCVFFKVPKDKTNVKITSLGYWLWKLDRNERFLWYQEVDNDNCLEMDMKKAQKIPVMEITSCIFEESYAEYMLSTYGRKATFKIPSRGIGICINGSKDPDYNIALNNQKVVNIWIDGLNSLLHDKLITAESIVEVKKLADFDVKVRLMYIDRLPEIRECEIGSKLERVVPPPPSDLSWIPTNSNDRVRDF